MDIERIGPYLLDRKIGSGGMGTVYLARHVETGNEVALKTLSPALAREEGFVQRFNHEIHSLEQLTNPHVVRLIDSGVDGEIYYYAMEYVEGETVTQKLRRIKRFPWQEVIEIAIQVCSALKAAHDAGIIHRDIKPSNLMLDQNDQVKLTDFGVAKLFAAGKLTATDGIIGTAEFMSPEQAQGKRVTKASDLYSLGVVMYTMLTGRPPYTGKSALEVIQKHRFGQFDKPSRYVENLPHWLEDIICGMLSKEPSDRPPDAYVLSRRLAEVLQKVELSQSDDTRDAPLANTSPAAATMTIGHDGERGGESFGGTLVRDLVRRELDELNRQSALERLLDNTWVLIGLLALLIGGGVLWFQNRPSSSVEEPTPSATRPSEMAARLRAQVQLKKWINTTQTTEVDRFVRRAIQELEQGDLLAARETLMAVDNLTAIHDDSQIQRLHQDVLPDVLDVLEQSLGDSPANRFPSKLLAESLSHANELAASGQVADAMKIWKSILLLYATDPRATEIVQSVRDRLANLPSDQPSSPTEPTTP